MKNFLQKNREILALLVYIVFVGALIYAVILPLMSKINSIKDQIQEESMRQESNKQRLNDLPKVQEQFKRLEENQSEVDVLLDKNNAVVLIEQLEKLADQSGDKIKIAVQEQEVSKTTSTSKNKNSPDTSLVDSLPNKNFLQLEITLTGNFDGITKFVKSLESFSYYNDVISLEIKKSDSEDTGSSINSGSFGAVNPFNTVSQDINKKSFRVGDDLEAGLKVVFYTK